MPGVKKAYAALFQDGTRVCRPRLLSPPSGRPEPPIVALKSKPTKVGPSIR